MAVTPLFCVLQVSLSRLQQAVKALLGESFRGILNSDRYQSYTWVELSRHQRCWTWKRDCTKLPNGMGRSRGQVALCYTNKKVVCTTWEGSAPEGALPSPFLRARTGKWVILKALFRKAFKITFQVVCLNYGRD